MKNKNTLRITSIFLAILLGTISSPAILAQQTAQHHIGDTETTGIFGANKAVELDEDADIDTTKKAQKKDTEVKPVKDIEINIENDVIETTGSFGVNDKIDLKELEDALKEIEQDEK